MTKLSWFDKMRSIHEEDVEACVSGQRSFDLDHMKMLPIQSRYIQWW